MGNETDLLSPAYAGPLTEEQIETYYREGYIVVEDLVSDGAIDAVVDEAKKFAYTPGGGWTPKIFDHAAPEKDAALHRLLVEPDVVAAVEQIFEAPARVYFGMLAVVPANGGKGLEWHQDNQYSTILGRALNVFIALCDITPDKAILWVAPESHLKGVQESVTESGHRVAATPENGMPLPTLKKGSVCIFDRSTLHHSKRNTTDEDRFAYAAQYAEEKARAAYLGGKKDPNRMLVTDLRARWPDAPRPTSVVG
jgi:ectoine hydroxylase-related dioxygenase (phytanoyl-CoA dioxygenase family)